MSWQRPATAVAGGVSRRISPRDRSRGAFSNATVLLRRSMHQEAAYANFLASATAVLALSL